MIDHAATLRQLDRHFDARRVAWALIGGLAVSVRTEPRFTRDIDLAVAVDSDRDAEAIIASLTPTYRVVALIEQEARERLAAVRLARAEAPCDDAVLDLMFASSGIEAEVASGADRIEVLPGVHAPVARRSHLIALKVLARDDATRPQDLIDIRQLLASANSTEVGEAEAALDLIAQRGFNRGKNLREDLARVTRNSI
ncbi:MAG: nucleotidyl transferase AbiEii/AbiGii toxin family protein [Chloroflexota bacterium]